MLKLKGGEEGSALVVVVIILIVSALTIPPLLNLTFSGEKSASTKETRMLELYAADSGIEQAMYMIQQAALEEAEQGESIGLEALTFDSSAVEIETPAFNECELDVSIGKVWWPEDLHAENSTYINIAPTLQAAPSMANGTDRSTEMVIVSRLTNHLLPLCTDGFESGTISGGTGWKSGSNWEINNSDSRGFEECRIIEHPEVAWANTTHLELTGAGGNATRIGNITGYENPYLQFKARADDFVAGDEVYVDVSQDGVAWTTVNTWEFDADTENGFYIPYNIPLTGVYDWSTGDCHIRFRTKFSGGVRAYDNFSDFIPHSCPCVIWVLGICTWYDPTNPTWNGGGGWIENVWTRAKDYNLVCAYDATSRIYSGGRPDGIVPDAIGSTNNNMAIRRIGALGIDSGLARRSIDLTEVDGFGTPLYQNPRLSFWGRCWGLENPWDKDDVGREGEHATISLYNGASWNDEWLWYSDQNRGIMKYYEKDLSEYISNDFKLQFDSDFLNHSFPFIYTDSSDTLWIDDIRVSDSRIFYVDEVVISDETTDAFKAQLAYTTSLTGDAFMDRLGIWLPPGVTYDSVIESEYIWDDGVLPDPANITAYMGGTALEWVFDNDPTTLDIPDLVALHNPPAAGPGIAMPYIRSLTIRPNGDPKGVYTWIRTWPSIDCEGETNPSLLVNGKPVKFFSWDTGCDMFKAVSTALHPLSGHATTVEAYAIQGEINRQWYETNGNYIATGNALMVDNNGDSLNIRETSIDGLTPSQSRANITTIPSDAEVQQALLYWSGFKYGYSGSHWLTGELGATWDENVDFMYPRRYFNEPLNKEKGNEIIVPAGDISTGIPGHFPFSFFVPSVNQHWNHVWDPWFCDGTITQIFSWLGTWAEDRYSHDFTQARIDALPGAPTLPEIANVKMYAWCSSWRDSDVAKPVIWLDTDDNGSAEDRHEGEVWTVSPGYFTDTPYIWDLTNLQDTWTWNDILDCEIGIALRDTYFQMVGCSRLYLRVDYWVDDGGTRDLDIMHTENIPINPTPWVGMPEPVIRVSPMNYEEEFGPVAALGSVTVQNIPIVGDPAANVTLSPERVCEYKLGKVGMLNGADYLTLPNGDVAADTPGESVYFEGNRTYRDVSVGPIGSSPLPAQFDLNLAHILTQPQPVFGLPYTPLEVDIDGTVLDSSNYTWLDYGNGIDNPATIEVRNPLGVGGDVYVDYTAYYADTLVVGGEFCEWNNLPGPHTELLIDDRLGGNITISYSIKDSSKVLTPVDDYSVNLDTGLFTLKGCLAGNLTIDYWAATATLGPGNYTIDYNTGNITILPPLYDVLKPVEDDIDVSIDYTGEFWDSVEHDATGLFGEDLNPVQQKNYAGFLATGHSYLCVADVTEQVSASGIGNGLYDVRGVDATPGLESGDSYYDAMQLWPAWAYSGWSLIVNYDSDSEGFHQFYLWDPIHNQDLNLYTKPYASQQFDLWGFNPPKVWVDGALVGEVSGRMTYCIGEGDPGQRGDTVRFKGKTQEDYFVLTDPTDTSPGDNDAFNESWLTSSGATMTSMDIDTFDVITTIDRRDTEASVLLTNQIDANNLMYFVLSFKTEPEEGDPEKFNFTIGTVNYQYTIGGK